MRLVLGSKARELYQSLDSVLEPPKPGTAAGQQVSIWVLHRSSLGLVAGLAGLIIVCDAKCTVLQSSWEGLSECPDRPVQAMHSHS